MSLDCEFNGTYVCAVCGTPLPARFDPNITYRKCKAKPQPPHVSPSRKGLGSSLARIFKFFGFKQKPGCGCARREVYLNEVGQRIHFTCIRLWNAVFPFWAKPLPYVKRKRSLNPHKSLTYEQLIEKVAAIKKRESLAKVKNL